MSDLGELARGAVDLFVHLDRHLAELTTRYGNWTYAILVGIVFCETGLVLLPFLPGDSLLFTAGAIAALGSLDPWVLNLLLFVAVIAGDNLNYWIGRFIGPRAFSGEFRFFRRQHLERTTAFFERHGGRTIVLARFVPIVRTFTPFVAGIGAMRYTRFLVYSLAGGAFWVTAFIWAGFHFGNLPAVRANFSLMVLAIIGISVLPILIGIVQERRKRPG
jgi:membrane-associated protein